jgi:hypothetical protein
MSAPPLAGEVTSVLRPVPFINQKIILLKNPKSAFQNPKSLYLIPYTFYLPPFNQFPVAF